MIKQKSTSSQCSRCPQGFLVLSGCIEWKQKWAKNIKSYQCSLHFNAFMCSVANSAEYWTKESQLEYSCSKLTMETP